MDNKKMIEIAGQIVIVGAGFIYMHKQIKNLKSEIDEIKSVMMKQQEFMEKNFMGMSKSVNYLMSKNRPQPVQQMSNRSKQKINITQLASDDDEQEIINQSNEGIAFFNTIPTLAINPMGVVIDMGMNNQQNKQQDTFEIIEEEKNIDDINDIKDELDLLEKEDVKEEEIQEPPKQEEKQPEVISVKARKNKVKK
jgi:Tfp pilus assembly protein PilE